MAEEKDTFQGVYHPDQLGRAMMVHDQILRGLNELPSYELRAAVMESVARFLCISVEPSVTEVLSILVQTIRTGFAGGGSGQSGMPDVISPDQGTENIVSLISKLMDHFPQGRRQELRDYLVSFAQSCRGEEPSSSEEPAGEGQEEASSEDPPPPR